MMIVMAMAVSVMIIYFLQAFFYQKYWQKGLAIKLFFEQEEVIKGENSVLCEMIENKKLLPLPTIKVKFFLKKGLLFSDTENANTTDNYYRNDFLSVSMYQRVTRKLSFSAQKRGSYCIPKINIVGSDLFFAFETMAEKDNSTFLYVLPRAIQNKDWEISYKKITGEMMAKRNIMEDPFEYMGIRNYQNFDNIRAVNWKATAKTRELKVNKKGYSSSRNVKIILCFEESDISFREELEEAGMDIAASLIEKFTKEGISLSVSTNGRDFLDSSMIKVMTGCGRDHAKQILRQLARVDFSQKRGTWQDILGNGLEKEEQDFVFIISSNICESMQRKMKETMHGKEFYWICPTRKEEPVKVENSLKSNFYPIAVERLGL